MIIDCHEHIVGAEPGRKYWPPRHSRSACCFWAYSSGPPYARNPLGLEDRQQTRISDPDGSYTIATMDQAGVDAAIVYVVHYDLAWGEESDFTMDEKHAHLAGVVEKYPGRIYPFAGVDPRYPNAVEVLKRAIETYGMKGLKLYPHMGYYPWDEKCYDLYDVCQDYGIPVALCSGPPSGGFSRSSKYQHPMEFSEIFGDYPDLTFIIVHIGFPFIDWFDKWLWTVSMTTNVYLNTDSWITGYDWGGGFNSAKALRVPNIDTDEAATIEMVSRVRDTIGAHRMLWGSDQYAGPAYHGDNSIWGFFGLPRLAGWWRDLPETAAKYGYKFTKEEAALMAGDNAARILGIMEEPGKKDRVPYGWRRRWRP